MKSADAQKDPAFPAMTLDIVGSVLSRTENPGELGKYITEEIRALTGAQCVLLIQHQENSGHASHRVVCLNPKRHAKLAQAIETNLLIEEVCEHSEPVVWKIGEGRASPPLAKLGFDVALAIPLMAGRFRVGALLALGLPDEHHTSEVVVLLKTLSAIVAISLRNSFLYEQQERIIEERTHEIQAVNQALRASLDEKVILLKEIHHRVKNNLQIIISLLNLQGGRLQNPEALNILSVTQTRVRSMALLHETLYRSENFSRIPFDAYLAKITSHLLHSFGNTASRVQLTCQARGIELGIDQAVPCGLIVNELVCNSLKYAFPGDRKGSIALEMTADEKQKFRLTVSDDGIGLPPALDPATSDSLGLRLVQVLASQLGGELTVDNTAGAKFHIVFPGKPAIPPKG